MSRTLITGQAGKTHIPNQNKGPGDIAALVGSAVKKALEPLVNDIDAIQQRQKANGQYPRGGLTLKQNLAVKEFEISANDILNNLGGHAA